ncbi:MAG: DUF3598 family protein [Cyanobacteria bacterium J06621_8]
MTPQEANWHNLFGEYTPEGTTWHALTTVYSLELEIIRDYQFTRKFSTNNDKTIVYHQNTYYLPDGQTKEQSWELEQQKCSQKDGVFHPEAEQMRAISFGNETSIWVSKQFIPDHNFGAEVFFQQQDKRQSIIPVYEKGKLARMVIIKENQTEFPAKINADKIKSLAADWSLKQIKMKPNLQAAVEEISHQQINFNLDLADNQSYFLPEKVYLNLPSIIKESTDFQMIVGQQITPSIYKQIKTQYDSTGKLTELISEVYSA